jgi:hypothetical protein
VNDVIDSFEEPPQPLGNLLLSQPLTSHQPTISYGAPVPAVPYKTSAFQSTFDNHDISPTYGTSQPEIPQHAKLAVVPHNINEVSLINYNVEQPAKPPQFEEPSPLLEYNGQLEPAPQFRKQAEDLEYLKPANRPHYEESNHELQYGDPTPVDAPKPVVLPAYTPGRSADTTQSLPKTSPTSSSFNFNELWGDEFPIVELITADSDIPEDQKFVSFSIGDTQNAGSSDDTAAHPKDYQATGDTARLAKDVMTGSVYVQPVEKEPKEDLYYLLYRDQAVDLSYGKKI